MIGTSHGFRVLFTFLLVTLPTTPAYGQDANSSSPVTTTGVVEQTTSTVQLPTTVPSPTPVQSSTGTTVQSPPTVHSDTTVPATASSGSESVPSTSSSEPDPLVTLTVTHAPYLQLGNAALSGYAGSSLDQMHIIWQAKAMGNPTDYFLVIWQVPDGEWNQVASETIQVTNITYDSRSNYEVTIHNLDWSSQYNYCVEHYLLGGKMYETFCSSFKTRLKKSDPTPFSFVTYGDSATISYLEPFRLVQKQINQEDARFAVLLGDNVYQDGTHLEFDARFDASLNPELNLFIKQKIEFPALGNHDIVDQNGLPSLQNYDVPRPKRNETSSTEPQGEVEEKNYSFDYGLVHFICFDSNSNQDFLRLRNQLQWIEQDALASDLPWKVAFAHHPLGGSPDKAEKPQDSYWNLVVETFNRVGIQLLLVGHSHTYHRTFPLYGEYKGDAIFFNNGGSKYSFSKNSSGLIQLTCGLGGNSLREGSFTDHPFVAVGMTTQTSPKSQFGFVKVDVTASSLSLTYKSQRGQTLDSFVITDEEDKMKPFLVLEYPGEPKFDSTSQEEIVLSLRAVPLFEIRFYEPGSGKMDEKSFGYGILLLKDGQMLRAEADFKLKYDEEQLILSIMPVSDSFGDGRFILIINGVADINGNTIQPRTFFIYTENAEGFFGNNTNVDPHSNGGNSFSSLSLKQTHAMRLRFVLLMVVFGCARKLVPYLF